MKEIKLNVGSGQPNYPGTNTVVFNDYAGGYLNNADSSHSRRMQVVSNSNEEIELDDEDEDDDDDDDLLEEVYMKIKKNKKTILENRVFINEKYDLIATLNNVNNNIFLESIEGAAQVIAYKKGKDLAKKYSKGVLKKVLDSTIMSVPIVDVIYGTYQLASIAVAIKEFSDVMSEMMGQEKGYFGQALISDDPKHWEMLIKKAVYTGSKDAEYKENLKNMFNQVLENIKIFIITLIEAYDTVASAATVGAAGTAVAPGAGTGVGAAGGAMISNATTFIAGIGSKLAPVERILFSGASYIAKGINAIVEFIFGADDGMTGEEKSTAQKSINDFEEKGGSVLVGLIRSPARTLARLHDLYNAVDENVEEYLKNFASSASLPKDSLVAELKSYSLSTILENFDNEDEDDDDDSFEEIELEEFSTMASGAVGGYTGPLGDEKRKNISASEYIQKEQIKRMRIMEAYHHRTTNNLK